TFDIHQWQNKYPVFRRILNKNPVTWVNSKQRNMAKTNLPLGKEAMLEADQLWIRFAPFLRKAFPESKAENGMIESPLKEIPNMKKALESMKNIVVPGNFYLKCDNALPVAGSIKARGG